MWWACLKYIDFGSLDFFQPFALSTLIGSPLYEANHNLLKRAGIVKTLAGSAQPLFS